MYVCVSSVSICVNELHRMRGGTVMGATAFPRGSGEELTAGQLDTLKDWVLDQSGTPVSELAVCYRASVRYALPARRDRNICLRHGGPHRCLCGCRGGWLGGWVGVCVCLCVCVCPGVCEVDAFIF